MMTLLLHIPRIVALVAGGKMLANLMEKKKFTFKSMVKKVSVLQNLRVRSETDSSTGEEVTYHEMCKTSGSGVLFNGNYVVP